MRKNPLGLKPAYLKILIALVLLVVIYSIAGFFVLPKLLKPRLVVKLSQITQHSVTIEEIKINPFSLTASIFGLRISDTNDERVLSLGELSIKELV